MSYKQNMTDSPRDRIEAAASKFFYELGYDQTGINQILDEACSHKASLYRHFQSKEKLAQELIKKEASRFLSFLQSALKKYSRWESFVDFWVFMLGRSINGSFSRGCPFLRYSQTRSNWDCFSNELHTTFGRAETILSEYFVSNYKKEEEHAKALAKQCLAIYEGSTQMVVATGDPSYLDSMVLLLKNLI